MTKSYDSSDIAVIGMACRFPGADSTDAFWNLLCEGRTVDRLVPSHRLPLVGHWRNPSELNPRGHFLDDVDCFDHKFFNISAREAAAMDPQQRLLLETAYQTLESSGYFLHENRSPDVGCYIGGFSNDYNENIASHQPSAFSALGALKGFQSGRISHFFGWSGPSITIDTVCSSSGVAIDAACKALRTGECGSALAGGVSIFTSPFLYQNLARASFLSPEARVKPFDARADGYSRGEGVGLVMLKPVAAAVEAGDPILGVVRASAVRQSSSRHITVPHVESQAVLYSRVLQQASVDPNGVTYIEAHGTGTRIGDVPEYEAIKQVFGSPQRQHTLFFASLKGNIGHAEGASGVAALIKTLLMIQHHQIPPQANLHTLNPRIALDTERLAIPTHLQPWQTAPDTPRLAIVNNFGAAGSISALIVQESATQHPRQSYACWTRYPVCLTAHTTTSLAQFCEALMQYLDRTDTALGDLCYTLSRRTNRKLPVRRCLAVGSRQQLREKLRELVDGAQVSKPISVAREVKPIILVFGGQSTRHVFVSRELFNSCAVFRFHLEACDDALSTIGQPRIIPEIFEDVNRDTALALQTMQFALQYCWARCWIDSGLRIDCVVGHSLGQLVALVVSGSLTLADGLRFVCGRASLIDQKWGEDAGGMISVQTDLGTVDTICQHVRLSNPSFQLEIACHNGPNNYVLVGNSVEISALLAVLGRHFPSVKYRRLDVTHGFHSKLTQPILNDLKDLASSLPFHASKIPLEMCEEKEASGPLTAETLVKHTRSAVYFTSAVNRIERRLGACTWIETGSNTIGMLRSSLQNPNSHSFHPVHLNHVSLADTMARLWDLGHGGIFWPFHPRYDSEYCILQLPPYQFDKISHWLDWNIPRPTASTADSQTTGPEKPSDLLLPLNTAPSSFRIDTDSHEWDALVQGHSVRGHPLVSASLHIELAIQAVRRLSNSAHQLMPRIDNFRINSPLGLSKGEQVVICLEATSESDVTWRFACKKVSTGPSIVAEGRISLQPPSEFESEFNRAGRLLNVHRSATSRANTKESNVLQQSLIYALLSKVVQYKPCYHVLHTMSFDSNAALASATLAQEIDGTPVAISCGRLEACIQVAALHAISLCPPNHLDDVFVCSSMNSVQFRDSEMDKPSSSLESFAVMDTAHESDPVYDIFVLNQSTREVLLIISRARFSKVNVLDFVTKVLQPAVHSNYCHNEGPRQQGDIMTKLQGLISRVTDIPVHDIYSSSRLACLGIDSLMMAEIQQEIWDCLSLSLSTQDLQMLTFGDIVNLVNKELRQVDSPRCPSIPADGPAPNLDASSRIRDLLSQHVDVPATVDPSYRLGDLGVDSLLAIEVANDLCRVYNASADARNVAPETTLGDLASLIGPHCSKASLRSSRSLSGDKSSQYDTLDSDETWGIPPQNALRQIQHAFHHFAVEAQCVDFWQTVHPLQLQLLQAYILEAFELQGFDLRSLPKGQPIPRLDVLPKYEKLWIVLLDVLRDGEIVDYDGETYIRSDQPIDIASSSSLHSRMVCEFPQHRLESELLQVTGPRLAHFLTGKEEPLQHLFGNPGPKHLIEELYTHSPMFLLMSKLLAEFLRTAVLGRKSSRPLRVLEIGAGTGGTTSWVLDSLGQTGAPVEYVFTDISPALVSLGRRKFGHRTDVSIQFSVLDIEQPGPQEMHESFDMIISTLCIHATSDLTKSLQNTRQLLRRDGFVALAEFTRRIPWLDLVFGLLDGWWLHSDGRHHALASTALWHRAIKDAGFQQVGVTAGQSAESHTAQIVCAFTSAHSAVGKSPNNGHHLIDIERETYFSFAGAKMAYRLTSCAALLIHGGGHIMLSRKDIPSKQVAWLLDHGIIPVSIDYRLCPEVSIQDGPITDVADAFVWVRTSLPRIKPRHANVLFDGDRVGIVGWSSGGMLALSTGWAAQSRNVKPPEAVATFYCPTDYEDRHWTTPHPELCSGENMEMEYYNLVEGVGNKQITSYPIRSTEWMNPLNARVRIYLHMVWRGQTLPILYRGLPCPGSADDDTNLDSLDQPTADQVRSFSPYAYMLRRQYQTPSYFVHGRSDQFVPWQQAQKAYETLRAHGVPCGFSLLEDEGHLFDLDYHDPLGKKWEACEQAYQFLRSFLFSES